MSKKEYIEKEAAIQSIKDESFCFNDDYDYELAVEAILDTPAANVKPVVKGEWIENGCITECSECGEPKRFPHWIVCPNCGADMGGESPR